MTEQEYENFLVQLNNFAEFLEYVEGNAFVKNLMLEYEILEEYDDFTEKQKEEIRAVESRIQKVLSSQEV